MKNICFFLILSFLLTSCVGKKKHLTAIQLLKREHQDTLTTVTNLLKKQLRYSQDSISSLQLNLAERKGENNVLNTLRGELSKQIEDLELQIESLSTSSQSSQTSLSNTLSKKEAHISTLKLQLKQVEDVLNQRQKAFKKLSADLLFAFQEMPFDKFELTTTEEGLKITFPKSVFFRKASTSKIEKQGLAVMESASSVLSRYPVMQIAVVGHTNNNPTGRSSIRDNWSLSALQAATIVNMLAKEYDVNTSQLTACGKGEFEPKTSNETKEGKALNDRIEWVISQRNAELERDVRKVLGKLK